MKNCRKTELMQLNLPKWIALWPDCEYALRRSIQSQWVSASDCSVRGPLESLVAVVFIATTAAIYSLGHGLCTFTTVPRSTQPSTLRGMAKWVSAYGLSNNNNVEVDVGGSCQFSVDSQPESIGLVWGFHGHPVLSLHSSNEPGELSQWLWSVMMIAP